VTAREVLDGIKAREARRQAMIEDGSYRVTQARCDDPERCGTHFQHPQNVAIETSHHKSYISHLEALADHSARLTGALERVLAIADNVDALHAELPEPHGLATVGYARAVRDFRAAIENALTKDKSQ
jgi:hypothetical protein